MNPVQRWMRGGVAALWAVSLSAQAIEIDLGGAAPYAAFVFEDVSGMTQNAGRLAVGGNLSLGQAQIGAGLSGAEGLASLLVRGNILSYSGGGLWAGGLPGHGLYLGSKASSVPSALDLRKVSSLPVDFNVERQHLSVLSEQLRDQAPTGSVTASPQGLQLNGSGAALEVFRLTAAQLAANQALLLNNVAPDAHIVLNVGADALRRLSVGLDSVALAGWKGRVLLNAHDAETVVFNGLTFWASVLATNACICNSTGRLEGSVVARKWSASMSLGHTPFVPKP